MADYTLEELQQMLAEKQEEEAIANDTPTAFEAYEKSIIEASDYEEIYIHYIGSFNTRLGYISKSQTEDKKIVWQTYYINEMRNGKLVGRSPQNRVPTTGSYNSVIPDPTLQIISSREVDTTVMKG